MRIELRLDELPDVGHFLLRDLQLVRDAAELVLAQLGQELGHDLVGVRPRDAAFVEVLDLDRQALAQVARADADRLLRLEHPQDGTHLIDRDAHLVCDVLDLDRQIALVVQAADEILGDGCVFVGQRGAHVHEQLFRQGLLGGNARQRVEFVIVWAAIARLRHIVVRVVALGPVRRAAAALLALDAAWTDRPLQLGPAHPARGRFDQLEGRVFRKLGGDLLLKLL